MTFGIVLWPTSAAQNDTHWKRMKEKCENEKNYKGFTVHWIQNLSHRKIYISIRHTDMQGIASSLIVRIQIHFRWFYKFLSLLHDHSSHFFSIAFHALNAVDLLTIFWVISQFFRNDEPENKKKSTPCWRTCMQILLRHTILYDDCAIIYTFVFKVKIAHGWMIRWRAQ